MTLTDVQNLITDALYIDINDSNGTDEEKVAAAQEFSEKYPELTRAIRILDQLDMMDENDFQRATQKALQ